MSQVKTWTEQGQELLSTMNALTQHQEGKKAQAYKFAFTTLQILIGNDKVAIAEITQAVSKEGGLRKLASYVTNARTVAFIFTTKGEYTVDNSEKKETFTTAQVMDSLVPLFSVAMEYKNILAKAKAAKEELLPTTFSDDDALKLYAKNMGYDLASVKKTFDSNMLKDAIKSGHAQHEETLKASIIGEVDELESRIIGDFQALCNMDAEIGRDLLMRLNEAFTQAETQEQIAA